MPDVWLRSNSRVSVIGLLLALAMGLTGLWLLVWRLWWAEGGISIWGMLLTLAGALLLVAGGALAWLAAWLWRRPRVACAGDHVVFQLGASQPAVVPVDVVECFFIGQGPAMIAAEEDRDAQAANVIVRLAESAVEWSHGPTQPALANWCDCYITIRGAWCEPIDGDLVNRMNAQLAEVHRQRKQAKSQESR